MIADETLLPQPRSLDVLCGRDREAFNHDGNVHYRFLVENNRERYQTANFREEKTQISQAILDEVLRRGRFLKFDQATKFWRALSKNDARKKVAHALRCNKDPTMKQKRKKKKKSTSNGAIVEKVKQNVNEVHYVTATVKECESKGTIRQYKSSIELDGFNLDLSVVDDIDDQIDDDIGDDVPLYHHGVDYLLSEFDSLLSSE
jgi:hypothetical protein